MAVYVDNMRARYGRMIMCHMMADTTEELLEMADRIGVPRKWVQKAGTPHEHFDICMAKRAAAVDYGARQITMRCVGRLIRERRNLDTRHNGAEK